MEKSKKYGLLAKIALLTATLIWGSTFVILKNALDAVPTYFILSFRFLTATLLLSAIFYKKWRLVNKTYLWQGCLIGVCLALAYIFQTVGLANTTPGKNAFLTATYCVLVPFMMWMIYGKKPDKFNVIAAFTCIVGIGLVSLDGQFVIQFGDWMTLVCGIFFGLQIVFISVFNKDKDAILMTIIQFFTAGIITGILSLCFETMPQSIPTDAWIEVIYLTLFGTTVAMLLQNLSQKHMLPSAAAIILTLEAVFGTVFSVLFYGEVLTLKLVAGFVVIFFAVLTSETKLEFLRKKRMPKDK
ncbi:MAG: DMT family transporter [Clostridia bacterium]|nr:DMT family transporter [Clostridia bacterium]